MWTNGFINNWDIMTTDNTWTIESPAIYKQTIPAEEINAVGAIGVKFIEPFTITEVFEMQVYDVIVIDTKECEVLHRQEVIAEDEKTAMLELNVTDEIKKLQKKGRIKFIFNQLGGFNRYSRKVKIADEEE